MSRMREHWLAVGRVSNAAREQLMEANCHVLDVHSKPPIVLVGLPYETASGQFSENMAFADVDEIEIRLKGLCLLWRFPDAQAHHLRDPHQLAPEVSFSSPGRRS